MYVRLRNHGADSKIEALLVMLVKCSKIQESYRKEMKVDILGSSQKVESHSTMIKYLEQ